MSIEKPKRSLGCSFAWLGPRSWMALETHPRDFGTKSSVRNSRLSPAYPEAVNLPLRHFSFAQRGCEGYAYIVFSHKRHRRPSRKLSRENIDREISKLGFKVSCDQFLARRLTLSSPSPYAGNYRDNELCVKTVRILAAAKEIKRERFTLCKSGINQIYEI